MNLASYRSYPFQAALLLALGLAWIWYSRLPPEAATGGRITAPHTGFMAPDFALPTADDASIRLADLRGQPVVVNLWASWCTPCRAEMPALERVYQEYADDGLALLAVNATDQDSRAAARAFASEQNLSFPILFDDSGDVSRLYNLRALPTTFFIDANGVIQEVVVGGPMAEALLRVRVEQLLRQPAPGKSNP